MNAQNPRRLMLSLGSGPPLQTVTLPLNMHVLVKRKPDPCPIRYRAPEIHAHLSRAPAATPPCPVHEVSKQDTLIQSEETARAKWCCCRLKVPPPDLHPAGLVSSASIKLLETCSTACSTALLLDCAAPPSCWEPAADRLSWVTLMPTERLGKVSRDALPL
jgi:hypothetical protein